jgi:hypothetical protein
MGYWILYKNLKAINNFKIDNKFSIKRLNTLKFIYYLIINKLPFVLLLIFIKNIFVNKSTTFSIYIIKYNKEIVHYTILQRRNNQFKIQFEKNSIEIGPSKTKKEYRNLGLYTFLINYIIKINASNRFFSIVYSDNVQSNSVFRKFGYSRFVLRKNKNIVSHYEILD